jgi:hypothetical protein
MAVNRLAVTKAAPLSGDSDLPGPALSAAPASSVVGARNVRLDLFGPRAEGCHAQQADRNITARVLTRLCRCAHDRAMPRMSGHESDRFSRSIAADLAQYVACETKARLPLRTRGRRSRQRSPSTLDKLAGNAATPSPRSSPPVNRRRRRIAGRNSTPISLDYQKTLDRHDSDVWLKQGESATSSTRGSSSKSGALTQAMPPVPLVRAYAAELAAGITIPGRPDVTQRINAILTGHAKSLSQILDAGGETKATLPAFPRRPGVADTLRYIPDFISIAGIVIIAEMVLPLTIFGYTYLRLAYRLECADSGSFPPPPQAPILPPPSNRDDRGGPVRLPPPGTNIHAGQARGRRRRLHGGRR